jgi:hypothetical protein
MGQSASLVRTNEEEYPMLNLTTWLLVVNTLIAVVIVAYCNGVRALVPMPVSLQPNQSVHTWPLRRQARIGS